MSFYSQLVRPLLFQIDPERVHSLSVAFLRSAGFLFQPDRSCRDPRIARSVFDLHFPNPVGLAAGFDKDGLLIDRWAQLGFGFVEVGTVTPRPQIGNDRPRLFRLPADRALINRMGFNNRGARALAARLARAEVGDLVVGVNIGKNKDTPNAEAVQDYLACFELLHPYADYFVVNVSSPNTPGLRELQDKEPLTRILGELQAANQALEKPRPLLLKLAPDLERAQLDDVLDVISLTKLDGLILANTTIQRDKLRTRPKKLKAIGPGGLSGAPLRDRAQEWLVYARDRAPELPLIGVGGIMQPPDAIARLKAGAQLVQTYTGFVYGGPGFVGAICRALVKEVESRT